MKNFIAILTSVSFESELILSQIKNLHKTEIAGKTVHKGRLSNVNILLVNTGIGKVNAAHSTTVLMENFPIKCIINSGVGGAYPNSGLKIGDIAAASKEIYGDEGVITSEGWKDMKRIGIPLLQTSGKRYFNEFSLDINISKNVFNLVTRYASPVTKTKSGNFVTLSAVTGTRKRALELERRFNAICENMEGAAIAQICAIYKVPMLEIRGISNIVGMRDKRKWNLKLASENCQKAVMEIITSL